MPQIRPFRALRYNADVVGDVRLVVAPPCDTVSPEHYLELLDRHPRNVARLDLPSGEPGDQPDDQYRRVARTFAAWRSDGTLHKDRRPSVYAYEQSSVSSGTSRPHVQRGFFGRLRLEPPGPGSGVRIPERAVAARVEDRYRLLRATGANMSPVVGLYGDPEGVSSTVLEQVVRTPSDIDAAGDDGSRHRLWVVPDEGEGAAWVDACIGAAQAGPITIVDGQPGYEAALRYRDERRMTRSCEEDPAFDYVLALLLPTAQPDRAPVYLPRALTGLVLNPLEW